MNMKGWLNRLIRNKMRNMYLRVRKIFSGARSIPFWWFLIMTLHRFPEKPEKYEDTLFDVSSIFDTESSKSRDNWYLSSKNWTNKMSSPADRIIFSPTNEGLLGTIKLAWLVERQYLLAFFSSFWAFLFLSRNNPESNRPLDSTVLKFWC